MKTIISSATKTRDNSIDILRSFALIAIILIHPKIRNYHPIHD